MIEQGTFLGSQFLVDSEMLICSIGVQLARDGMKIVTVMIMMRMLKNIGDLLLLSELQLLLDQFKERRRRN